VLSLLQALDDRQPTAAVEVLYVYIVAGLSMDDHYHIIRLHVLRAEVNIGKQLRH
jgi:hypothetical protein